MLFSPKKECGKDFSIFINGQNIHQTAEAKYLGVYLIEKLKWDAHIQHFCKIVSILWFILSPQSSVPSLNIWNFNMGIYK